MTVSRSINCSTTIHRNLIVNRTLRRSADVRYLWWWGRHGRAWWSSQTEDIEERMRRHQTIMMQRYSKALRRRAMWEREDSPPSWSWRLPGRLRSRPVDRKAMSSTEQMQAKLEDHESTNTERRRPWEEFHTDFESFKAAVDKAIERDPYGTLFGRRLRSPPSNNNSSWTSWSWIFDPKDIKEDKALEKRNSSIRSCKETADDMSRNSNTVTSRSTIEHTASSGKTETFLRSTVSQAATGATVNITGSEYVYDPISGRKVVKQSDTVVTSSMPAEQSPEGSKQSSSSNSLPRKSFFETLFGEHGVDIPVKTYKAPKVYGYGGECSKRASKTSPITTTEGFESSRRREYQLLRAATIGNNIDTTAEYGGKFETEAEKAERLAKLREKNAETMPSNEPENETAHSSGTRPQNVAQQSQSVQEASEQPQPEKNQRVSPAPDDNTPLFSGTTYASRSSDNTSTSGTIASAWLVKEGFQQNPEVIIPGYQSDGSFAAKLREPATKLESALDRTNAKGYQIPVKPFSPKLQPSIDRLVNQTGGVSDLSKTPKAIKLTTIKQDIAQEKREDVDLLRASDVRAAAKMARLTRQQKEESKNEARAQLEKDFESQKLNDIESKPAPKSLSLSTEKLSQGLMNVWKHIKDYPTGIVAKTFQNMGVAKTDAWKNYVRPNSKSEELLKPLLFKDETLSKTPSIFTQFKPPKSLRDVEPTAEVLSQEQKVRQRDEDLRLASVKKAEESKVLDDQLNTLADQVKEVYEAEYGKITPKHRQLFKAHETKTVQSIRNPTVKPGVIRDIAMEKHIGEFEPRYATLVDRAKNIKRGLHEVSLSVGAMQNERAIASVAARDNSRLVKVETTISEISVQTEPDKPTEHSQNQVPTSDLTFESPFILLNFSKELGQVQLTPLNSLIGMSQVSSGKPNAMAVIGSLNNASAFVKHFVDLDKNGYELASGGGDVLFFRKKQEAKVSNKPETSTTVETQTSSNLASTATLRQVIAAQEIAAQPRPSAGTPTPATTPPAGKKEAATPDTTEQKAATVLDEIPVDVPTPGPAAPTAPPTISNGFGSNSSNTTGKVDSQRPIHRQRGSSRIRRQEEVFSGQRRSQPTTPGPETQPGQSYDYSKTSEGPKPRMFQRIRRFIKRTILTAIAFGGGAYVIGVVAEGLGAQAQIDGGDTSGPRKKVVMPPSSSPGQRAGIFSTESSR